MDIKDLDPSDYIEKTDSTGSTYYVWAHGNSHGKQPMAFITKPKAATVAASKALSKATGRELSQEPEAVLEAMRQIQQVKRQRRKEVAAAATAAGFSNGDEALAYYERGKQLAEALDNEEDANKLADALLKARRLSGLHDDERAANVGVAVQLVIEGERAKEIEELGEVIDIE